jgi:hypothetical protein
MRIFSVISQLYFALYYRSILYILRNPWFTSPFLQTHWWLGIKCISIYLAVVLLCNFCFGYIVWNDVFYVAFHWKQSGKLRKLPVTVTGLQAGRLYPECLEYLTELLSMLLRRLLVRCRDSSTCPWALLGFWFEPSYSFLFGVVWKPSGSRYFIIYAFFATSVEWI